MKKHATNWMLTFITMQKEGLLNASHNDAKNNRTDTSKSFLATHQDPKRRSLYSTIVVTIGAEVGPLSTEE